MQASQSQTEDNLERLFKFCPTPKDIKAGSKQVYHWPRKPDDEKLVTDSVERIRILKAGSAPAGGSDSPDYTEHKWERIDDEHICFVTTNRDGPSWDKVSRRETYELDTDALIACDEVTGQNRNKPKGWNNRLPSGRRATRTALWYRENSSKERNTETGRR